MLPRTIAIIALNMNNMDLRFIDFSHLSAEEKIVQIENRIRYICNELKTKEPHTMWLVVWREYGITAGNRAISTNIKHLFKKTMQQLIQEFHPNLTIIAGTVLSKKNVNDINKLEKLKKYYTEISWIKEIENKSRYIEECIDIEEKIIYSLKQEMLNSGIVALRNTCYVFHNQGIWRHDKTAPIREYSRSLDLLRTHTLFQPGNKTNNNPYLELIHPITESPVAIGIEICREHVFSTLKKNAYKKSLLHIIMSDSVSINLDNIWGDYVLHLDSLCKPRLILMKNEDSNQLPIHLYQSNILDKNHHLSNPLQPLYPFVRRIADKFDELILQSTNETKELVHKFLLNLLKNRTNWYMRDELMTWLKRSNFFLQNHAEFQQNFSIKKWLQEINDIIVNDPYKDVLYLDYQSRKDAPPIHQPASFCN